MQPADIRLPDLIADPCHVFPKLWPVDELARTVENNDWHLQQDVLSHTYAVAAAACDLESVSDSPFTGTPVLSTLAAPPGPGAFAGTYSRLDLLKAAAFLHDVGKPSTLRVDDRGFTRCPDHPAKSLELLQLAFPFLDMTSSERQHVLRLIALHHAPDAFLDFVGDPTYNGRVSQFLERAGDAALDVLALYVADFEGCTASPDVLQAKPRIYAAVRQVVTSLLGRPSRGTT